MRAPLLGMLPATGVRLYRPWQYTWAFGQDAGASRSDDWKDEPCSKALAASRDDDRAEETVAAQEGNLDFIPGSPGHTYFVHGFRSQKACKQAHSEMGTEQWDRSRL